MPSRVAISSYFSYLVRFIDFGSLPCFIALSELASTEARRKALRQGYAQYVKLYAKDLESPGPYLRARVTKDLDEKLEAYLAVNEKGSFITIKFPTSQFVLSAVEVERLLTPT